MELLFAFYKKIFFVDERLQNFGLKIILLLVKTSESYFLALRFLFSIKLLSSIDHRILMIVICFSSRKKPISEKQISRINC